MNKESSGKLINITDQALSKIAIQATFGCYGVVGLAYPSMKDRIYGFIKRDGSKRGIKITRRQGNLLIDMYVVLEYGTNLNEVAKNLSEIVKFEIEKYTRFKVDKVDIHINRVKVHK